MLAYKYIYAQYLSKHMHVQSCGFVVFGLVCFKSFLGSEGSKYQSLVLKLVSIVCSRTFMASFVCRKLVLELVRGVQKCVRD